MTAYLLGSETQPSVGRLGRFRKFNRASTQAEKAARFMAGVAEADRGASQINRITGDSANFEGGTVGSWVANSQGGSVSANSTTPIAGTFDLQITTTTSDTAGGNLSLGAVAAGQRFLIAFDYIATGGTWQVSFRTSTSGSGPILAGTNIETSGSIVADGVVRRCFIDRLFTDSGTPRLMLRNTAGSIQTIRIDNVQFERIGNTVDLSPSSIQLAPGQWLENSGNKGHVHIPDGCRLFNPETDGQVRGANTWAASDTLQYITGVDAPVLPLNATLTLLAKASASATFDLGDGVDQDRYGVGVTIGTEWAPVMLAKYSHDATNRDLTIKPTESYTGTVETVWKVEVVA